MDFYRFFASKTCEVVAGKTENLLARVGEFGSEAICTRNYRHR